MVVLINGKEKAMFKICEKIKDKATAVVTVGNGGIFINGLPVSLLNCKALRE